MIYLRLRRLNGELTVDGAMTPDIREADKMVAEMLVRLRPGWSLTIEHEGKDPGEDLDL